MGEPTTASATLEEVAWAAARGEDVGDESDGARRDLPE